MNGFTLVLLPGLASDHTMWRAQIEALSGVARVHVSDVHFRFDSIESMAQALLDEVPGPLALCGASMGGIVSMQVVRQAPQRVVGLALLGSTARPETPDIRALREAAMELFAQGRMDEVLSANLPLAFHQPTAELTRCYLDFVNAAGADQLIRQNQTIIHRPDARLHLAQIRCPTLVMCGAEDQLTPLDCSREIAAAIPGASLIVLPECGHMLTMEKPDEVNAALLAWLGGLRARAC